MTAFQQLLQEAVHLHQANQLSQAQALYLSLLQQNPQHADLHHLLGTSYLQQQRFDLAMPSLLHAVQLSPLNANYRYNLGNAYLQQGDYADAKRCFQEVLRLNPNDDEALGNLGVCLSQLHEYSDSINIFDKLLKFQPHNLQALNGIAHSLNQLDRTTEAIAYLRLALQLAPDFLEAKNNLANSYKKLKQFALAESIYQMALQQSPEHATLLTGLANLRQQQEHYTQAQDLYRQVLARTPDYHEAAYNLSLCLFARGHWDQAYAYYQHRPQHYYPNIPVADIQSPLPKRTLISKEQGIGDQLRYSIFLNYLNPEDAHYIEMDDRLIELMQHNFPALHFINSTQVNVIHQTQSFAAQLPLPSLGHYFAHQLHEGVKPLSVESTQTLNSQPKRIGLCWRGYVENPQRRAWYLPLSTLLNLFKDIHTPFELYLLQPELTEQEQQQISQTPFIWHHDSQWDLRDDFKQQASLLGQMDLVISCVTSLAELAGRLQIPTWILSNQHEGNWWLTDDYWHSLYPNHHIIRKPNDQPWDVLINKLRHKFNDWMHTL